MSVLPTQSYGRRAEDISSGHVGAKANAVQFDTDPKQYIDAFMRNYFEETARYISHEEAFIKAHALSKGKVDYFKLKRFLTTALRSFREIDDGFIAGLLQKLQKDVYGLFDYYQKLTSATSVAESVYQRDFLTSVKPYQEILQEVEKLKVARDALQAEYTQLEAKIKMLNFSSVALSAEKQELLKKYKRQYSDTVHSYGNIRDKVVELMDQLYLFTKLYRRPFMEAFVETRKSYLERLTEAINTKAYHLDKLLWVRASQNKRIVKFLHDANIVGNYDMRTFIHYYIRNINIDDSAEKEWHAYLVRALGMLD
jgi:hypothetical protein